MVRNVTIIEVARKSGTSPSTVSRVLNDNGYPVNDETRKRVRKAAEELGYRPNIAARQLRSRKNLYIAVIVPTLNNPFYSAVVSEIEKVVLSSGYILQIYSSNDDPELENRLIDLIASVRVAGLMISSANWNDDFERKVGELGVPVVLFDRVPAGYRGHHVGFDFIAAGRMAASFLIEEGHRDIVLGTGPLDRDCRREYMYGFLEVLAENGIPAEDAVISVEEERSAGGAYDIGISIARTIINSERRPTAVAVFNDIAAMGVIKRFELDGISVPADISVMGLDDIPFGYMMTPGLTTIRQSVIDTGRMAASLIISLIDDPEGEYENTVLQPVLIRRESVRKISAKKRKEFAEND